MTKKTITIQLEKEAIDELEKRAKKELLSLSDLIEEILRRSVLSYKGTSSTEDKVDDKFISYFSRKKKK